MIPTLQLILRIVCLRLNVSETEMRLGVDDRVIEARCAFLWLATQLTEHSVDAIGLFIGRPPRQAHTLLLGATRAREANPATTELLDEIAVECVAEASARVTLGRMPADIEPGAIARHVVGGRLAQIGTVHLQHLASAYLATLDQVAALQASLPTIQPLAPLIRAVAGDGEVAALLETALALDDARFSPAERQAQQAFDTALRALIRAARNQHRSMAAIAKSRRKSQQPQRKDQPEELV